jgi:hypothetical protein
MATFTRKAGRCTVATWYRVPSSRNSPDSSGSGLLRSAGDAKTVADMAMLM